MEYGHQFLGLLDMGQESRRIAFGHLRHLSIWVFGCLGIWASKGFEREGHDGSMIKGIANFWGKIPRDRTNSYVRF